MFGLLLALLLTKHMRLLNFHRGVMFMPSVLSTLIVGMVFTSYFNPAEGLFKRYPAELGLDALALPWLTSSQYAFGTVMAVDIWKGTGYIMTVLIAGLMSISPTYYEAADIDSANGFQKLRYITLPLLMPTLATTTVMNVIYGLKVFDMIYALTNGGPGKPRQRFCIPKCLKDSVPANTR